MNKINHLGHIFHNNIYLNDASKCTNDFYIQFNAFMGDNKGLSSKIKHRLFSNYCTSFYGVQFLPVYDHNCMNKLYVAWRTALKKVWRLPRLAHNNLIPMIADVLPAELMCEKRSIKFINRLRNSSNKCVNMITGMGIYGTHSVIGRNFNHLCAKYDMSISKLYSCWKADCQIQTDLVRRSDQIKELIEVRDSFVDNFLSRTEAREIIDFLSTG